MVHLVHDPAGLRAMRGLEGDFAQLLRASALQVYRWDGQSRRTDNGGTVLGRPLRTTRSTRWSAIRRSAVSVPRAICACSGGTRFSEAVCGWISACTF